jgi:heat shock protein HslJ
MRNTRKALAIVAVAAAVMLSGCASAHSNASLIAAAPEAVSVSSSPVGTWGTKAQSTPNAVFNSDGTVTGSDGCNDFQGTWNGSAGPIAVGPLWASAVACPSVDTWLTGMTSVTVSGDTLAVYAGDKQIGTLTKG